jgi:pSer/pThr/pTyr-binding forkhead associated (FHA) protein
MGESLFAFSMTDKSTSRSDQLAEHPVVRSLRLGLEGTSFVVELTRPEVVLGRHTGCDVRLPLPDVSRRHCRFVHSNGNWSVHDLESMNGIYVNEERVSQAQLKEGDVLGIGGFRFEVHLGNLVSAAASGEHAIVSLPHTIDKQDPERRKAS